MTRELTSLSFPDIGDAFGGRDHTTVINACNRITDLKETETKVAEDYFNLLRTLSH
ncbi:helix-turn-helix domain-containing protein [Methyloglobulus sp.]|uniref:helix-turn-helix domain-containing protein n=1 Tax=Methyloglobulus sp. TaxID=2518622 RepID=UPI0032B881D8